jgi:MFS family permease
MTPYNHEPPAGGGGNGAPHPHHHHHHHHHHHAHDDDVGSVHTAATSRGRSHLTDLSVTDLSKLQRLGSVTTRLQYTKVPKRRRRKRDPFANAFQWWARWSVPGLGMLSEAYVIFSTGLIGPFQESMFPSCFGENPTECSHSLVHATKFAQIAAIVVGMLAGGAVLDSLGRQFGSRCAAAIMTVGSVLLTFSSFIGSGPSYLGFFLFSQIFYGVGVGGEYPSASASAAERAQSDPALRDHRGRQMCLTFSQQGMGNLVNCAVILLLMLMYGQTGAEVDGVAARNIVAIQFAVATAIAMFMMAWRAFKLKESAVWSAEHAENVKVAEAGHVKGNAHASMTVTALRFYWPRLFATSMVRDGGRILLVAGATRLYIFLFGAHAPLTPPPPPPASQKKQTWLANDFAFYGNKLFMSSFLKLLYPGASLFVRMQWTLLNSVVSLMGYYCSAWLIDKQWYGRRRLQMVGFCMLFALFLVCAVAYPTLLASTQGLHAFQALYFLSSFFNQFGPNCVTWLAAAEVFPTEVRATFQGTSAATGKIGAIIADVAFGLVNARTSFYMSSAFGLVGALLTWLFLPDTTGMSLDELDRMSKYMLAGEFEHYHGQAVAPKHLSVWELRVWRWHEHHDPEVDRLHKQVQEDAALAATPRGGKDGDEDWLAAIGHAPLSRVALSFDGRQQAGAGGAAAGAAAEANGAKGVELPPSS